MINTYQELKYYIQQDALANRRKSIKVNWRGDEIWDFIVQLRHLEYYKNLQGFKKIICMPLSVFTAYRFSKLSIKLGFSIPINVFEEGLSIAHRGTIVVNSAARIGKNCRIHEGVTIGATNGERNVAVIGDNVFIASGAKIIGNLTIANDVAIAANAVVVKSILEEGTTWGGVPAKKISINNSHKNLSPMLELEK